jgi:prevent-host-death family protein
MAYSREPAERRPMNDMPEHSVACTEAQAQFDDLLERAAKGKERVILTRRGKAVAALVPIEDLKFLEAIEDQFDVEEFQRAKEEFERSGEPAIPLEEVVRKLGIKA